MQNLGNIQYNMGEIKKSRRPWVISALVTVAVLAVVFSQQIGKKEAAGVDLGLSDIRQVKVVSVRDLSLDKDPLPLLGKVQSQSSATIYSQVSGEVIALYKKLGDAVWDNQVIAELNNWSQRSAVTQAKASVEVVQANLDKIKKGGTDTQISILKTTLDNSQKTLDETKTSVISVLNDAFAKADDSVRNRIDIMFRDPRGTNPQILFSVSDSQLEIDIEWERLVIEEMLNEWSIALSDLSVEDNLINKLDVRKTDVDSIRSFLDKMALAVNVLSSNSGLSETTINIWKSSISGTRSIINGAIASLSASKNALNGVQSGFEIAQLNYDQAETGGRSEDVTAAEAQLKQVEAGLQSAYANLEKTIIRASISGTINTLNLEKGDFVSAFQPVVKLANNNSLEVIAYITEEDRIDIMVGAKVMVGSQWQGEVKNIAPAIDAQTKKIKVEINVKSADFNLTNGQSVALSVERVTQDDQKEITEFSIPISALKIGSDDTVVFTVDGENKLVSHSVTMGPILGEKIIIKEGLTADMEIVVDARGLKKGETVESQK